jgi:hypothetical protein
VSADPESGPVHRQVDLNSNGFDLYPEGARFEIGPNTDCRSLLWCYSVPVDRCRNSVLNQVTGASFDLTST